jgi:hypothetical protein
MFMQHAVYPYPLKGHNIIGVLHENQQPVGNWL